MRMLGSGYVGEALEKLAPGSVPEALDLQNFGSFFGANVAVCLIGMLYCKVPP